VDEQWDEKVNVFADTGGWSVSASDGDPSNVASCPSAVGEIIIIGTVIEGAVGSWDNEVCPDRTCTSFRLCNIPKFGYSLRFTSTLPTIANQELIFYW
jgi:hypothetical protein